jgi:hypothetical protein
MSKQHSASYLHLSLALLSQVGGRQPMVLASLAFMHLFDDFESDDAIMHHHITPLTTPS